MTPFQAACEAHAEVDGNPPRVRFEGRPMWGSYAGETRVILMAFLAAVKPADAAEEAVVKKLLDMIAPA